MRRAGLVLLGLLSVADIVTAFLTDGEFPPLWIAVLGGILGLASLAVLVPAWRGNRIALGVLIALRVISAATALPAFGVTGVPGPVMALAGAIVVLTAVGCLLAARRSPVSP
jgi:hypothetical protein